MGEMATPATGERMPADRWSQLAILVLQDCASSPAQRTALERYRLELSDERLDKQQRIARLRALLTAIDPSTPQSSDFGEVLMI